MLIPTLTYQSYLTSANKRVFLAFILSLGFIFSSGCMEDPDAQFKRLDQEASDHYAQRDFSAALAAWEKALQIREDSAHIYKNIGKTYIRLAEVNKAAEAFTQVVTLKPNAWDAWLELAQLQLISGDIATAEAGLKKLQTVTHNNPAVLIFQGDLLVVQNRFDKAEAAYRQAVKTAPQDDQALIKLASCYEAQGKVDEAEQVYHAITAMKPGTSMILIQMSNYWKLKDDLEKAKEFLLKAVSLEPEDMGLQKMLAEFYYDTLNYVEAAKILASMTETMPKNRSIKKLHVEVLMAQHKMDEAQKVLTELSIDNTNDMELDLLNGKYHLLANKPGLAANSFKSTIDQEPNLPIAHYLLALAYLSGTHNQLARQSLIKALTLDPYFSDAELLLADVYYKNEEYDLSLEHATRICEREPENFRSHLIMGHNYLAMKQYNKAMLKFEASRRINPESDSPPYYMAMTAEISGDTEKALQYYQALLEQKPNLADASMRYAQLLIKEEKSQEATKFFKDTTTANPNNGYLYHVLGEVYLASGNTIQAKVCFRKAIDIDQKLASSYLRLAEIYKKENDRDAQIQILKKCLGMITSFPEAYVELAGLHKRDENCEEAINIAETGVTRNPESTILSNNLAWLYLECSTNIDKALNLAQSTYEKLPEDAAVADTLGWAYYKKGSYTQALWMLEEAHSRMPDNALIQDHIEEVKKAKEKNGEGQ